MYVKVVRYIGLIVGYIGSNIGLIVGYIGSSLVLIASYIGFSLVLSIRVEVLKKVKRVEISLYYT